jgi:filamentous hemagglutinin family protein
MLNDNLGCMDWQAGLLGLAGWIALAPMAFAQNQNPITPDTTLGAESSTVDRLSPLLPPEFERIDGGAVRGQNLFHSFEEFGISETGRAYFISPSADITNIFSRVTGSNPSEIFGVLGTLGSDFSPTDADLFLINPNGIIFGENAALDVGGSFTATTASGVQFGDAGNFSAVEPEILSPFLTINASALFLNQLNSTSTNTAFIRSNNANLAVAGDETLALIGGAIEIDGGILATDGGYIYLEAVDDKGIIALSRNGQPITQMQLERANISIKNQGSIISLGPNSGEIGITAKDILVADNSAIITAISGEVDDNEDQVGDISIQAYGNVYIRNQSLITNQVFPNTFSDGGNIRISADRIEVTNGSRIRTLTEGVGNAGDIYLDIVNTALFEDTNLFSGVANPSGVFSTVRLGGTGNGGNILINAHNLEVANGAHIDVSTNGQGNAGDLIINIPGTTRFDGFNILRSSDFPNSSSGAFSNVEVQGVGNGGNINITTGNLEILDGARLTTSTSSSGNSGNVNLLVEQTAQLSGINENIFRSAAGGIRSDVNPTGTGDSGIVYVRANNLEVSDGAQISASTFGEGNAGDVLLEIAETAYFAGVSQDDGSLASGAYSDVIGPSGSGSGGNVRISAKNLAVMNGAALAASTFGEGDAGDVTLEILQTASFDGSNPFDGISPSFAGSTVARGGFGDGGTLQISANNLQVTNGANLSVSTFGEGDAGELVLNVIETVRFDGVDILDGDPSTASSQVNLGANGDGGTLKISTTNLLVTNGATISASTFGTGNAGDLILEISEMAHFHGVDRLDGTPSFVQSVVAPSGKGGGGIILINATDLMVTDGAQLIASTFGEGDAGDLILNINEIALVDGINPIRVNDRSLVGSTVEFGGSGDGGNLQLTSSDLKVSNGGILSTASGGIGNAGNLLLNVQAQVVATDGTFTTSSASNSGGQIRIQASEILLIGNSDIQTFVNSGRDDGGNITVTTDLLIALNDSDILAFADDGAGGNITLQTPAFFGQNFTPASLTADPATLDGNDRVDINATGAISGVVTIPDVSFIENSLNDLTDNIVVTDQLLAGSCIARAGDDQATFVNTGSGGLPVRPDDIVISNYATGDVQPLDSSEPEAAWQPGDPIVEPTGAFPLADGRLVLSRECDY